MGYYKKDDFLIIFEMKERNEKMQEFEYRLEKEDYKNWIHWNVLKHESKKMKMISALIYVAFLAIFLGKGAVQAKGNPVILVPSVVIAVVVGFAMFYTISNQNQERIIWKRSGLKNLEKTGKFPVVHLTLDEKTLTMTVAEQEMTKTYSYSDIEQMVEIERMYLLETNEKTWQFIAKSAFPGEEERKHFENFMNEKLADAKENPDEYPTVTMSQENSDSQKGVLHQNASLEEDVVEADTPDEPEITRVDTSHMGKIGKMAHFIGGQTSEENEENENNNTESDDNSSEQE